MKNTILTMRSTILILILLMISCSQDDSGSQNADPIDDQNQVPNDDSIEVQLRELLSEREEDGFYGSVFIQRGNDTLINDGFGFKNLEEDLRNDPNTIFDIGSVSKQFTGAAILALEMQGRLSVEDSLHTYLDNIPLDKQNITIHQLLTHSSGLTENLGDDYDVINTEMYLEQTFASELESIPGESYVYSNVGYSILGILIEEISGQTYEEYLRENLWLPAGMNQTGYRLPDFAPEDVAHGYQGGIDFGVPNSPELWFDAGYDKME